MEVARAPGGFLMPHQMYHGRRPTNPAAAAGGGPRRIRMRTPHEFFDGTMVGTPSVDVVGDDDSAPASFTAWIATSGGFRGVPAAASAVAGLAETTVTAGGDGEETCCAVCLDMATRPATR
ncbi:hypothetical protein C2845_PM05G05890 [Panicum miliaceum]|uniref:Uncharacterized protein n=1 Tax=Panicum miliaceum TaxID=4540 RepID=A0A3L6SY51_PANMI|nr:hypothetical protein C2845_PM05G05890 [Panicum miliaceum]